MDHWILLLCRPGNIVLLQFLVGLKQATEDELVADLVVNVLKATPDILSRYFKETQYAYAPRLKTTWQNNVKLLKKVTVGGKSVKIISYQFLDGNSHLYISISDLRGPARDIHSLSNSGGHPSASLALHGDGDISSSSLQQERLHTGPYCK